MKLAEALQERADLNKKIEQLKSRLEANATVQEGEKPAEDPNELLTELNSSIARLELLIAKINMVNCHTSANGKTLTELLAEKDCLSLNINTLQNLRNSASRLAQRATRSEIKILSSIDVKKLQSEIDKLSKRLRIVDNSIQEANWSTTIDL
ncbi:MAG: DIP1984 family protein [Paludibacteraceae bacterium]|nr:DIP1984 family protein [Paludibacteraceae bacterium]MEE1542607.1 DIP1984 family protein [Paludibacteraceae bacterium]